MARYGLRCLARGPAVVSDAFPRVCFDGNPKRRHSQIVEKRPVLDLDNPRQLFLSLPTARILRSLVLLDAASFEPLVDLGSWVVRSRLMRTPVIGDFVLGFVRKTFFEHFCAGSDHEELRSTVIRVHRDGLRSMLVYGVEDAHDRYACDRNLDAFLRMVEQTKFLPPDSTSFIVAKITSICTTRLLERASDLLRWERRDPSFRLPWKLDCLPIFADSSPLYHTLKTPSPLTQEEESELHAGFGRLRTLCDRCKNSGIPLAVDAECTRIQPAIDYMVYSASIEYNTNSFPTIFGTIQAYLKDAKQRMIQTTVAAEKLGISMGFKLVRGAYMSNESNVASSLGFESPIHRCIQDTHDCFNDCASFLLEKISGGNIAVILATHNVESGKMAVSMAKDMGLEKQNRGLQFAQLFGMADALSLSLRNEGFVVSKYMPFGPVEKVMRYLLRRAEENRGVLSTSSLDRNLMKEELKRRATRLFRPAPT